MLKHSKKILNIAILAILLSACKIVNIVNKPPKEDTKQKKYDLIETFYDGYANVMLKQKWGRIDTTGKEIIPTIYDGITNIDEESYSVVLLDTKMGLIGKKGEIQIKPSFENMYYITSMRLAVSVEGLWGVVDDYGNEVLANQFDDIITGYDDYAVVSRDYKSGIVNIQSGELILPCTYDEIIRSELEESNSFVVRQDMAWGIYNVERKTETVPCDYDYLEILSDQLFTIEDYKTNEFGEEYSYRGLVNDKNEILIPAEYEQLHYYPGDHFILAKKDSLHHIFTSSGQLLASVEEIFDPEEYDDLLFNEDLLAVSNNNKWSYITKNGSKLNNKSYDGTYGFDEAGTAQVCVGCATIRDDYNGLRFYGGKWGHIDKAGKEIVPLRYNDVNSFYTNNLVIVNQSCVFDTVELICNGGKEGAVNKNGQEVVRTNFDKVMFSNHGTIEVNNGGSYDEYHMDFIGGKWGFFDSLGSEITPVIYDDFYDFMEEEKYAVQQGELWGLMDYSGRLIGNIKYNMILPSYIDGGFIVGEKCTKNTAGELLGGEWYFINQQGEKTQSSTYELLYASYNDSNFIAKKNGKYGLISPKGVQIIPFEFDFIQLCEGGYSYLVNKGGKYSELDDQFKGGKWGICSKSGEIVLPISFDEIEDYTAYENFMIVQQGGKDAISDAKGKLITPLIFDQIVNTYNGILPVEKDGKFGAINLRGEIVIPIVYELDRYLYGNEFFLSSKDSELLHED